MICSFIWHYKVIRDIFNVTDCFIRAGPAHSEVKVSMTSKEKRSCEAAQNAARTLTAMKIQDPRYKQSCSSDVPIFTLSADPTAEDFIRFYDASKERSRNICPFSITGKLKDGTPVKIPVTPAKTDNVRVPDPNLICFHVSTILTLHQ